MIGEAKGLVAANDLFIKPVPARAGQFEINGKVENDPIDRLFKS